MSPIISKGRSALLLFAVVLAAAGCGTPNDLAVFDADTQKHIADWVVPKHAPAAQADIASCVECHGEDLTGGTSGVSCDTCHINGLSSLTGCTSCHGKPPLGITYPNRRGAHTTHNSAPSIKNECGICHSGAGIGNKAHANGAVDVAFLSSYSSNSGAAGLNTDGTCSNVSCHGGKMTPVWATGTIDVSTQCAACHAYGTGEYNSYHSGRHDKHVNELHLPCTNCHDTTKLAVSHFTSLNTPTIEGPASATLKSSVSYTGGSCAPLCHGTENW